MALDRTPRGTLEGRGVGGKHSLVDTSETTEEITYV